GAAARDQQCNLDQRDETGANHRAMRHIELRNIDAGDRHRIAADQQADAKHRQCQTLPIKATPKADIGILSQLPAMPTRRPTTRSTARRPPASPARIASAATTPGGQVPLAGKTRVSNMR